MSSQQDKEDDDNSTPPAAAAMFGALSSRGEMIIASLHLLYVCIHDSLSRDSYFQQPNYYVRSVQRLSLRRFL